MGHSETVTDLTETPIAEKRTGSFDIVWFDAAHEKTAMSRLSLLKGGDDERIARGMTHHYRMWRNAPMIQANGNRGKGNGYCVATARRGSVELRPGRLDRLKMMIAEYCSEIVEVEQGFIGAYLKPEIWQLPNFVEAAKCDEINESKAVALMASVAEQKKKAYENQSVAALRSYFETVAIMVLPRGTESAETMSMEQLKNLSIMAAFNNVRVPSLDEWMTELAPKPLERTEREYDPLSFLTHAHGAFEAGKQAGYE